MRVEPQPIRHWDLDDLAYEERYNVYAGRFFPYDGLDDPEWGGAWVVVPPGVVSTKHSHLEKEMFFIVEGQGVMRLGGEEHPVSRGDTIYITPGIEHSMVNVGPDRLVFLDIWWDTPPEERAGSGG